MVEIGVEEVERSWENLLDRVEQGEEVVITRDGKPVARMVRPIQERIWTEEEKARADAAYASMRAEAKALKLGPFNWEEYKAMRDEGRP